ncbi:hypothetical protein D9M71_686770 [compost metagenome]
MTQSSTLRLSLRAASGRSLSWRYSAAARRLTLSPPGMMPSLRQPAFTQSCITCQIFINPALVSAGLRQAFSFSRIRLLMDRPVALQWASRSRAVLNG